MNKKLLNNNLSNNEIASGNFSENKLVIFDVDFKGLENSVSLFFPSMRNAMVERYRAETFYKIGMSAQDIINLLGLEIKPIPPKAALPLFDKMSLEHEEGMYDLWAKLLVASTNEYNPIQIQYADILSQIGNAEAILLNKIFTKQDSIDKYRECLYEISKETNKNVISGSVRMSYGKPQSENHTEIQYYENLNIDKIKFPYYIDGEAECFESDAQYATPDCFYESKNILNSLILLQQLNLIHFEYNFIHESEGVFRPKFGIVLSLFGYKLISTLEKYNIEAVSND